MDPRTRTRLFLFGGVLLLGGVGFFVIRTLTAPKEIPKPVAVTLSVVMATVDIPPRVVIGAQMVQERTAPAREVPQGALRQKSKVIGYVTREAISAGEAVRASQLSGPADEVGLSWVIPPGTRAMALRVRPERSIYESVLPGDHIDVYTTFDNEYARPVAENLLVLAVDHKTSGGKSFKVPEPKPPAPTSAKTGGKTGQPPPQQEQKKKQLSVTVAATPEQTERLALVRHNPGTDVYFVIRPQPNRLSNAGAVEGAPELP